MRYKTSVEDWTEERDLLQVSTNHGTITCKLLVNAAGPWAGRLGNLPLTPLKRPLFVTTPLDWLEPNGPSVWDSAVGCALRPESAAVRRGGSGGAAGVGAQGAGGSSHRPTGGPSLDTAVAESRGRRLPVLRAGGGRRRFTVESRIRDQRPVSRESRPHTRHPEDSPYEDFRPHR